MDNQPVGMVGPTPNPPKRRLVRRRVVMLVVVALLLITGVYGAYVWLTSNGKKDGSETEKILTVADLDNPNLQLNPETSDASVANLGKELKAKIDKQIADKENPIKTVRTTIGTLCNTANADRPTQCIDFIEDFLKTKMDALKLTSYEYGIPDESLIASWRAELYADLAHAYGSMGDRQAVDSTGKPIDAAAESLRYINLYLEIAQNPANWGEPQTTEDGRTWYYRTYEETDSFIKWRDQLVSGGV